MFYYLLFLFFSCIYFMYGDVKNRKLGNVPIAYLSIFQIAFLTYNNQFNFDTMLIVFVCGFILFYFGFLAAGDVKLASVLAMTIGLENLDVVIILVLFVGGAQSIYYLIKHYWFLCLYKESNVLQRGMPYGVAICIGFYIGALLSLV